MILPETTEARTTDTRYPERRGASNRSVIVVAKEVVATIDLADRLCGPGQMRKVGKQWAALCPFPDHQERTPSFTVYPETNSFFCYGCIKGGDVIELARFAWGYEKHEAAAAAAQLLTEFGYPIPERPPAGFRRQERQVEARQVLEDAKIAHLQRRVFRRFMAFLESIKDEQERQVEAGYMWEASREIAVLIWAGRRAT